MLDWLNQMKDQGLRLWVDESDSLRYQARKGVLTPELRDELQANRPQIIAELRKMNSLRNNIPPIAVNSIISDSVPLTFAQERQWQHLLQAPNHPNNRVMESWLLRGPLDLLNLELSLNDLVARQSNLRVGFSDLAGTPRGFVIPKAPIKLKIIDLSPLGLNAMSEALQHQIDRIATPQFDLIHPPLMHAAVLRLRPNQHVLVLALHALIADTHSLEILREEWAQLYNARCKETPLELPSLPCHYGDYARWQRKTTGEQRHHLNYWRSQLNKLPPQPLPFAQVNPVEHYDYRKARFAMSGMTPKRLRNLVAAEKTSIYTVVLTAWKVLLNQKGAGTDLAVATEFSQRSHPRTQSIIGPFQNTLILRTSLHGNPCFLEALRRVRQTTLEADQHKDVPFVHLKDMLETNIPTRLNFYNSTQANSKPIGLEMENLGQEGGVENNARIILEIDDCGTDLKGTLVYDEAFITETCAWRLVRRFRNLLDVISKEPGLMLRSLAQHLDKSQPDHKGYRYDSAEMLA